MGLRLVQLGWGWSNWGGAGPVGVGTGPMEVSWSEAGAIGGAGTIGVSWFGWGGGCPVGRRDGAFGVVELW